jgi:hypothetical protein
MLNVYSKFDKPKTLTRYKELRPVIVAINKLLKNPNKLKPEDKELLLANTHLKILASEVDLAVYFAKYVLEKRFPEAEDVIAKDPHDAFAYARDIIKGRWADIGKPEVEQIFLQNIYLAYAYARDIIKGRWVEAEQVVKDDSYYAFIYARDVIKGRFIEGEPAIKKEDFRWRSYLKLFTVPE